MKNFRGKVAVVTGAASGIGRAMAVRLRDEGMRLVLGDIDAAALDVLVGELTATGGEAIGLRTDVSRRENVEALSAAAVETFGGVQLLCNNAGVYGPVGESIWLASETEWHKVLGVNLWGVINGVSVFLPLLLEQEGETHIVNTASMTGFVTGANVYSVSKHALISYTEALYGDINQVGAHVGVSVLCPGFANTALLDEPTEAKTGGPRRKRSMFRMLARASLQFSMSPEQVVDRMIEGVRANQLYIVTDHEWDDLVRERADDILRGQNPTLAAGVNMQSRWPWARPSRPGAD